MTLTWLFLTLISIHSFAAAPMPGTSKGEILDKAERRLLYNYTRTVTQSPTQISVKREYTGTDGSLAASETSFYQGEKVVKMELDQKQTGEQGFFEVKEGKIHFTYTKDGKTKTDSEDLEPNTVSTDEVGDFLRSNWEKILKGDTLNIRFPVISRQETVGFKFFKDREDDTAVYIKMKPSSVIIAALVDPLVFKFEKTGEHRLLEVNGRVTPKKKDGDKWKDLDAIMVIKY